MSVPRASRRITLTSRLRLTASAVMLLLVGSVSGPAVANAEHGGHYSPQGWYGTIDWIAAWDEPLSTYSSQVRFQIDGSDRAIRASASISHTERTSPDVSCAGSVTQTGSGSGLDVLTDFVIDLDPSTGSYSFTTPATVPFTVLVNIFSACSPPAAYEQMASYPFAGQRVSGTLENGVAEGTHDFGTGVGAFTWSLSPTPIHPPVAIDDPDDTTLIEPWVCVTKKFKWYCLGTYSTAVVDVLTNDYDPDGGDVRVTGWTQPTYGSVHCDERRCTYVVDSDGVPKPKNETGCVEPRLCDVLPSDTFTYTITDDEGLTDVAEVTIRLYKGSPTSGEDGSCCPGVKG